MGGRCWQLAYSSGQAPPPSGRRISANLIGDTKKVCRIAWRFQASDQNRCNRVAFFRHAVARLEGWLHGREDFDAPRLGCAELVAILDEHPELAALNSHIEQKKLGE